MGACEVGLLRACLRGHVCRCCVFGAQSQQIGVDAFLGDEEGDTKPIIIGVKVHFVEDGSFAAMVFLQDVERRGEVGAAIGDVIEETAQDGAAAFLLQVAHAVPGLNHNHVAVTVDVVGLPCTDLFKALLDELAYVGVCDVPGERRITQDEHWRLPR